jgi:phage FluMu gp28-like protein
LHKTTIVDAVEQGFVEKIGEVTGKNWTRKDWLANMESQYSKEAGARSSSSSRPKMAER